MKKESPPSFSTDAVTPRGAGGEGDEVPCTKQDKARPNEAMDQGMELKGCVCRIKNCAVELFSMEEELVIDDKDSWDLVGRDLRLKATFLYIDLSRVISCYESEEHKNALSVLVNKFFYFMDELGDAVKSRSIPLTQVCYNDTADALREVVAALVPSLQLGPHLEE